MTQENSTQLYDHASAHTWLFAQYFHQEKQILDGIPFLFHNQDNIDHSHEFP